MSTPPRRPTRAVVPVTRRAVLLGTAGAVTAGCTGGLKVGRDGRGRPRRDSTTAAEKAAERTDPDVTLAAAALAAERLALTAVEAAQARHVRLRRLLDPTAEVHRAHIALLADAAPEELTPPPAPDVIRVPRSSTRAVARLAQMETELATNGRRHAFTAESGPFARLLASMAASADQQAALLRDVAPAGRRRG